MNFFKRLFGGGRAQARTSMNPADSPSGIEDVRSSQNEDGEIILNLWYVTNRIVISSLRAKAYVASGSDDEKLRFLRMRANHDFREAQIYPIPENLKADVRLVDGSTEVEAGKACTHDTLEFMGGYPALFRDIMLGIPKEGFRFNPSQAMICITALEEGPNGKLSVRIDKTLEL